LASHTGRSFMSLIYGRSRILSNGRSGSDFAVRYEPSVRDTCGTKL